MKKSVLFVLFALISVAGFSQITGWNAKVGMNFSNYTGDLDLNAKVGFKPVSYTHLTLPTTPYV